MSTMYDLSQAASDFPWTRVKDASVEPWRDLDSGWMEDLPEGWGDVIHDGLVRIDAILREHDAADKMYIAQVKEKFGTLRFYYDILGEDGLPVYRDEAPWTVELFNAVRDMETSTGKVCCFCGTREGLRWRSGWVHLSCDACEDKFR